MPSAKLSSVKVVVAVMGALLGVAGGLDFFCLIRLHLIGLAVLMVIQHFFFFGGKCEICQVEGFVKCTTNSSFSKLVSSELLGFCVGRKNVEFNGWSLIIRSGIGFSS
jgi:hypothetical protein